MMNTRRNVDAIRQLMSNCILPRIEQTEIHPLDTPELSKLLAFLKGHEHEAFIVTAIFTGLRSGELLGLTWDSVDFENGLIRVTKQLAQLRKKGEVFRFATPKNSKPRTIAPAPTVFQVLKKYKEAQEAQRKALGSVWNDGGFPNLVFTHPDGSHLSQPTAWKIPHKVLIAAGIDAHHFHDLRHTYVVSSIRAGDDAKNDPAERRALLLGIHTGSLRTRHRHHAEGKREPHGKVHRGVVKR